MKYGHIWLFKILKEGMNENPSNAIQWIKINQWFHGNLGIVFHTQLEHPLLCIKPPMIKQRWNQWIRFTMPHNFWLIVPSIQYFQVLSKVVFTIKLYPILGICNAHGIKQGALKELTIQIFDQLGSCTCKPSIFKRKTLKPNKAPKFTTNQMNHI